MHFYKFRKEKDCMDCPAALYCQFFLEFLNILLQTTRGSVIGGLNSPARYEVLGRQFPRIFFIIKKTKQERTTSFLLEISMQQDTGCVPIQIWSDLALHDVLCPDSLAGLLIQFSSSLLLSRFSFHHKTFLLQMHFHLDLFIYTQYTRKLV